MHTLHRIFISILFLACVTVPGGCARHVSLSAWQKSVEQFADDRANGDLTDLRNYRSESGRPQLTIFSEKSPAISTDITGLLLGRRHVQGEDWYIFLVGVVKKRMVDDIRIVALRDDPVSGRSQWVLSREESAAVETYRRANQLAWRNAADKSADRKAGAQLIGFPGEGDAFRVVITGNTVTVTDQKSGARWTLTVTPTPRHAGADNPGEPDRKS